MKTQYKTTVNRASWKFISLFESHLSSAILIKMTIYS